jgi:hypothetical protein
LVVRNRCCQCAGKAKKASTHGKSYWNFSTISGTAQRQRAQNRRAVE